MRILNVGCGTETFGTDFVDIRPSRPEVIKCDVSKHKLPYKNGTFDKVYSKNLLEHSANIFFTLNEMFRVLKKKGKIFILTDNAAWIMFHLPIRKNNYLQHYSNEVRDGNLDRHYFLFTPLHLKNLLEKVGFIEINTRYAYVSRNPRFKYFKPFINFLNKTSFKNLINPHIIVEATKWGKWYISEIYVELNVIKMEW